MTDTEAGVNPTANHVICWACNVVVQVPYIHGVPAEVFKCGWCGAITDRHQQSEAVLPHSCETKPTRRCPKVFIKLSGWAIVAVVVLVMASIVGMGIVCLLPRVWDTHLSLAFHIIWTVTLIVNVSFNYCASVLCSAGTVKECIPAAPPGTQVQQQAYKDYTHCRHCRYMKPPRVHHCRICQSCIVDMDHHCPFINNCVGRANLRNFVMFLFWTLAAAAYILLLTLIVMRQHLQLLKTIYIDASHPSRHSGSYIDYVYSLAIFIDNSPWWLLGTAYLFACSIGLLIGVGLLFLSQLRYIMKGVSYIQSLKGGSSETAVVGFAHLCCVLGSSNPLMWLVPRWGPPTGVLLKNSHKKRL